MYKYILLIVFLSGCNFEVETDVQINPFICSEGWQYEYSEACLSGLGCNPKTDDYGAQLTCDSTN